MKSRVTTTRGDQGATRLLSGDTVPKSHVILDCTGAVDTVRAQLALLRLQVLHGAREDGQHLADFLFWVLHTIFLLGAEVNDPKGVHPEYRHDTIGAKHLRKLEAEQSRLEQGLALPRAFIVTASTLPAAQADHCATVVRDLERQLVRLSEAEPAFQAREILPFVNRLSDFLFILARHLEDGVHTPVDYSVLDGASD